MSLREVLGILVAVGPVVLLVWMFVKSEVDQAPVMDKHNEFFEAH